MASKTATDAACESRECLHSMQSCEEEKPHLWVNLLTVNEDFEDKRNTEICFLVTPYPLSCLIEHLHRSIAEIIVFLENIAGVGVKEPHAAVQSLFLWVVE